MGRRARSSEFQGSEGTSKRRFAHVGRSSASTPWDCPHVCPASRRTTAHVAIVHESCSPVRLRRDLPLAAGPALLGPIERGAHALEQLVRAEGFGEERVADAAFLRVDRVDVGVTGHQEHA